MMCIRSTFWDLKHLRTQADPGRGAHCRTLRELRRGTLLSSLPPDSVILQAGARAGALLRRCILGDGSGLFPAACSSQAACTCRGAPPSM
jgi:hypothetical protein